MATEININQLEMDKFVRQRGVVSVKTMKLPLDTIIDEASATVTYIGTAPAGSATSSSLWQIKKIDTSSGTTIKYADGDTSHSKIWDNRANFTY